MTNSYIIDNSIVIVPRQDALPDGSFNYPFINFASYDALLQNEFIPFEDEWRPVSNGLLPQPFPNVAFKNNVSLSFEPIKLTALRTYKEKVSVSDISLPQKPLIDKMLNSKLCPEISAVGFNFTYIIDLEQPEEEFVKIISGLSPFLKDGATGGDLKLNYNSVHGAILGLRLTPGKANIIDMHGLVISFNFHIECADKQNAIISLGYMDKYIEESKSRLNSLISEIANG